MHAAGHDSESGSDLMPATFSHPAAVLALRRFAPERLSMPALIIGSMAPDLGYFLLLFDAATMAHTTAGLFFITLPSGLIAWALLQLAWPLMARMMPPVHARFLGAALLSSRPVGGRDFSRIALSVLIGGATHLVWDSFTHKRSWFVETFPTLRTPIPIAFGFEAPGYYLLQHGSSLVGLIAVLLAYRGALRRSGPAQPTTLRDWLPLFCVAVAALIAGCATALPVAAQFTGSRAIRTFAFRGVTHSLALGFLFLLLSGYLRGVTMRRQANG